VLTARWCELDPREGKRFPLLTATLWAASSVGVFIARGWTRAAWRAGARPDRSRPQPPRPSS
jgi:hypothetical protein